MARLQIIIEADGPTAQDRLLDWLRFTLQPVRLKCVGVEVLDGQGRAQSLPPESWRRPTVGETVRRMMSAAEVARLGEKYFEDLDSDGVPPLDLNGLPDFAADLAAADDFTADLGLSLELDPGLGKKRSAGRGKTARKQTRR